jgi:hypothetical protein
MNGDHPERLGYAWLEFGRIDADGTAHFCTIGVGLRAVAGRPSVDRWFFTTSLRPRSDFAFVERAFPLGKDRLAAALGEAGQFFTTAEPYRRAGDERLFGLGADRYRALVDLLVQLRQSQLCGAWSTSALTWTNPPEPASRPPWRPPACSTAGSRPPTHRPATAARRWPRR